MLKGFWAIVFKEGVQIRRDPSTRFVFLIPALQTIIFGFAIDMDVQHIPTVVFDMDRSVESRRLIESFQNTGTFDIVGEAHGEKHIREQIIAGNAKVGILIPPDYSSNVISGKQATLQVLVDGSDSTVATNAVQTSLGIGQVYSLNSASIPIDQRGLDVRPWVLFNPNLESSHFYVPGIIGIILQIVTVFLTAFAIVRERERGTLEQLAVTPVSKWALILGKLLPYSIIGMAQTLFVLVLMRYVFLIPVEGDLMLLLALSILFLLPALSMGILVSTVSQTQAQATQIGLLIMLPSVLLSGFAFPRETMPLPIYLITFLIPVTYYVQILRGIILRGAGLWALWPQTVALAAFTIFLVVLSSLRFQKRMG